MAEWYVGPRFYWKSLRILNYFAMNGPSNKGQIERSIRPPIDKPTIYKAVAFLEENGCIELCRKDRSKPVKWNGLAKYFQVTPVGLGELFLRWYDANKYKVSEIMTLRIVEKNPHLGYGAEWVETVHVLAPLLKAWHVRRWRQKVPWPGTARLLVKTGGPDDTWLTLSQLISTITTHNANASGVSADIRELLRLMKPYPTYSRVLRQVLEYKLINEIQNLRRARISVAGIQTAVPELERPLLSFAWEKYLCLDSKRQASLLASSRKPSRTRRAAAPCLG